MQQTYVILCVMGEDFGYGWQARIPRAIWDTFGINFEDLYENPHCYSSSAIVRKCKLWAPHGDGIGVWNTDAGWEPISTAQIYQTQEQYPGSVHVVWTDVE